MKALKDTNRAIQPASKAAGRLAAIESAVVANQVAEVATEKKPGKTAAKKPRSKATKSAEAVTTVEATIDVGFGNSLFIRGEGAGLSWDKGQPLTCLNGSTWTWSTKQAADKVVFKLLLNDQSWAQGADVVVEAGKKIQFTPSFG